MLFIFFSVFVSCCALTQNKSRATLLLLFACICFPTGHAYSKIISLNGIYFYDFFTLTYLVVSIYRALDQKSTFIVNSAAALIVVVLNVFLLLFSLFFDNVGKFFIKDIRPILNAAFFIAATDLFFGSKVVLSDKKISALVMLAAIFSAIKYSAIYYGFYGFQDEYYEANSYRYIDGAAYFCAIYLIFAYFSRSDVKFDFWRFWAILSAVFVVFLANSRFVVFGILVCIVLYNSKSLKNFLYAVIFCFSLLILFILVSSQIGAERILENMSFDGVLEQFDIRFSPAIELINNFDAIELFFGHGAGTYFIIPWFEYRGLDVMHSNIDSAYLTYYVKYGLVGFIFLYYYAKIFVTNSVYATFYRIFLGIIYFVEAAQYQPFVIGFVATLVFSLFGAIHDRRYR